MKRIYYLFLMMTLSVMITVSLYFSMIYVLVIYRVIPLRNIIEFTDLMLSRESYLIVASIGAIFGYFFGKHWWQIIYVDGVYYFDRSKKPEHRSENQS